MRCPSCGTLIESDTTQCPSCGTLISTYIPDALPYEDTGAIPYIPYNPSTTTAAPTAIPGSSTSSSETISSFAHSLQPPLVPSQQPAHRITPQQAGRLSGALALLIILGLLIVLEGGGALTYAIILHPAELQAQATAVTRHVLTAEAQAAATAFTLSPQGIYNRTIKTKPTFSDPLNSPSSSPWVTTSSGATGCSFINGAYHIHIAPQDFSQYCPAYSGNYSNFIFQIQVTVINGLDAGFTFRGAGQSLASYALSITDTGLYALDVIYGSQRGGILAFGRSPAIHTGLNQPNLIAVLAENSSISLFINQHFVTSINDSTYSSGSLALFADNFPGTAIDVAFRNAQEWNLP